MKSSIFAVKPPVVDQLWYGNNPLQSESPYVVRYKVDDYNRIESMQNADKAALNKYWSSQPELKNPEFLLILSKELEKQKNDPSNRLMHIWELAKFRLKKMLPPTMPFEERKQKLIESEAWNCWINQNNKHLAPDEFTLDNIDKEIENVAIHWGINIQKQYDTMNWIHLAMNEAMCEVYIP